MRGSQIYRDLRQDGGLDSRGLRVSCGEWMWAFLDSGLRRKTVWAWACDVGVSGEQDRHP